MKKGTDDVFIGLVNHRPLTTVGGYTEAHVTVRYLQLLQLNNNTVNNSNSNIIIL